ncbi:VOC family protein [Xanthobacter dioxanivorans]|uniref:VOC family protein n=1 Tax=Xanthobacter dioxanivorans TaxID=2528964 RepID=A0A974SIT7_9HYPH|nr:VOC family protein [Xanthobacter dioxanivorans]QRG07721.1 VOC family protein [Xanthobacter dioxanivorans]
MPVPTTSPSPALRLHLVTLGVGDLARACAFYSAMGLEQRDAGAEGVAFFMAGHVVLSLFPRHRLAEDATLPDEPAQRFAGQTLACNVASEEEVAALIARAAAAGGTQVKPAQKVFWGGTSGYFADPDGHLWEVAHNPFFPFDAEGRLTVPKKAAS